MINGKLKIGTINHPQNSDKTQPLSSTAIAVNRTANENRNIMVKPLKIEGKILNASEYAKMAVIKDKDLERSRVKFERIAKVKIL